MYRIALGLLFIVFAAEASRVKRPGYKRSYEPPVSYYGYGGNGYGNNGGNGYSDNGGNGGNGYVDNGGNGGNGYGDNGGNGGKEYGDNGGNGGNGGDYGVDTYNGKGGNNGGEYGVEQSSYGGGYGGKRVRREGNEREGKGEKKQRIWWKRRIPIPSPSFTIL
uniref:Glycine, alanine and asparagine-rich protein-like n=1 Tax=Crassostrea virginica TaxID=6565 RepID=A0A8B8BXB5_CRAVI|nr:glycine, alanine and asparagine-rich protein-like [Crassostrea virginica]